MSDRPIMNDAGTGPRDPEQLEATATTATAEIAPETHMGAVHLTVADLGRSIRYYEEQIGLEVVAQDDGVATLGTGGRGLLVLTELPGCAAVTRPHRALPLRAAGARAPRPGPLAGPRRPRPRLAGGAV